MNNRTVKKTIQIQDQICFEKKIIFKFPEIEPKMKDVSEPEETRRDLEVASGHQKRTQGTQDLYVVELAIFVDYTIYDK